METLQTIFKSVIFDASLILDAYGLSEESSRFHRKKPSGHAEQLVDSADGNRSHGTTDTSKQAAHSVSQIRLSSDDATNRSSYLGLEPIDFEFLRTLEGPFEQGYSEILGEFYEYLINSREFQKLISASQVERLSRQVRSYWQELIRGGFDQHYAASRMRIGVIHEHIGVEPQLYLTALSRQVVGFLERVPIGFPNLQKTLKAFSKALFFDITFVIDSYMDARAKTLVRTEGFASQLMKGLRTTVVIVDTSHRVLFANENFVSMTGIEPSLICRMPLLHALPIRELKQCLDQLEQEIDGKISLAANWGNRLFRITSMALRDEGLERPRSFAIVMDDISEIVTIANDCDSSANRHDALADALPALSWEMDLGLNTIQIITRQSFDLLGYADTWFLGKQNAWQQCIDPQDVYRFNACCHSLQRGASVSCEYRMRRASGDIIWIRSVLQRTEKNGDSPTIAAVNIDVTSDRLADERRMFAIGQVTGGIAHIINNALTVIMGSIEVFKSQHASADPSGYLEQAMIASQRAATTIKQLRAFMGDQFIQPSPVAINPLLSRIPEKHPSISSGNIRVVHDLTPNLWTCNLDVKLLLKAIDYVIENALQAMPDGGILRLETRNVLASATSFDDPGFNRNWIEVRVIDTGHGMSNEVRKQSVEPFFTTRNRAEFDGLGLSFAYGFVAQSGGHLMIESSPGTGTTVILRFPKMENDLETHDQTTLFKSKYILIVEDDERILKVLASQLMMKGFIVFTAVDTEEALSIAKTHPIDFLISDVILRDVMNGIDLAHKIANENPDIRVLIISGFTVQKQLDFQRNGVIWKSPLSLIKCLRSSVL